MQHQNTCPWPELSRSDGVIQEAGFLELFESGLILAVQNNSFSVYMAEEGSGDRHPDQALGAFWGRTRDLDNFDCLGLGERFIEL